MFMRLPQLKICAEVRLRIHHNLLANCEQQEIRRVYSKPQALSQCRNWLSKNVPHALAEGSVQHGRRPPSWPSASRGPPPSPAGRRPCGTACASSSRTSRIRRTTRRASPSSAIRRRAKTGHDKTAIMFRMPHNPGSLVDALDVFKQNKLNLTWIESFPAQTPGKPEYIFFVDFEGHLEDPKVNRTLKALAEHCEQMTILGSFPMARRRGDRRMMKDEGRPFWFILHPSSFIL